MGLLSDKLVDSEHLHLMQYSYDILEDQLSYKKKKKSILNIPSRLAIIATPLTCKESQHSRKSSLLKDT